jgi:hypothetical protein
MAEEPSDPFEPGYVNNLDLIDVEDRNEPCFGEVCQDATSSTDRPR